MKIPPAVASRSVCASSTGWLPNFWVRCVPVAAAVLCAAMVTEPLLPSLAWAQEANVRLVAGNPVVVPDAKRVPKGADLARVSQVAVAEAGGVFLVDDRKQLIRLFSNTGKLVASGSLSPDATHNPVVVSVLAAGSRGSVFVLDQPRHRVHRYLVKAASITEIGQFSVDVATDMCVLHDDVYLLGYHAGSLLHEYSSAGAFVRSFYDAPGANSAMKAASLVGGARVNCVSDGGIVLVAAFARAEIRAFAPDGTMRWTVSAPDFHALRIEVDGRGSVTLDAGHGPVDNIESLFAIGQDLVGVQIRRGAQRTSQSDGTGPVETIVLRQKDGKEVGTQRDFPTINRAGSRRFALIDAKGSPSSVRVFPLNVSAVRP